MVPRERGLAQVAAERGQDWAEVALDILAAEEQNVFCFYVEMSKETVRLQIKQPWITYPPVSSGSPRATRACCSSKTRCAR
jgi:N-acyl-D-amino-acid deacylase